MRPDDGTIGDPCAPGTVSEIGRRAPGLGCLHRGRAVPVGVWSRFGGFFVPWCFAAERSYHLGHLGRGRGDGPHEGLEPLRAHTQMRAIVEDLLGSLFRDGPYEGCPRLAEGIRSPVDQSQVVFCQSKGYRPRPGRSQRFHWVFPMTDVALDADECSPFAVHHGAWLSRGQSRAYHAGYLVGVRF